MKSTIIAVAILAAGSLHAIGQTKRSWESEAEAKARRAECVKISREIDERQTRTKQGGTTAEYRHRTLRLEHQYRVSCIDRRGSTAN